MGEAQIKFSNFPLQHIGDSMFYQAVTPSSLLNPAGHIPVEGGANHISVLYLFELQRLSSPLFIPPTTKFTDYGIVNLASSGAIEASRLPSSESGSMSVKSENSNPGATEQPPGYLLFFDFLPYLMVYKISRFRPLSLQTAHPTARNYSRAISSKRTIFFKKTPCLWALEF